MQRASVSSQQALPPVDRLILTESDSLVLLGLLRNKKQELLDEWKGPSLLWRRFGKPLPWVIAWTSAMILGALGGYLAWL